jgi:hypothetical protein
MATSLDPKQLVSFEELLTSQFIQQEALTRLLVEKGMFTKEEFLEMVRMVDQKAKSKMKKAFQAHIGNTDLGHQYCFWI